MTVLNSFGRLGMCQTLCVTLGLRSGFEVGQLVCANFLAFLIWVALPDLDRTVRCADRALLLLLSVFTAGRCMHSQPTPYAAAALCVVPPSFAGPTFSLGGGGPTCACSSDPLPLDRGALKAGTTMFC